MRQWFPKDRKLLLKFFIIGFYCMPYISVWPEYMTKPSISRKHQSKQQSMVNISAKKVSICYKQLKR